MPARALPDLIARIRVDSTGVDSAMTNLVGSFGRASLALAGVAAGIGLLVMGGKSMIDITEKHDAAMLGLSQAYAATGTNLDKYQGQIDDFIKTNRRYITDQSEVISGYATLTRSGLAQNEVPRVMNDAVDLAAIKHISLTDAVSALDNAEHGRMRGLIDLGITTAKYTDANGNLILASHSVAQAMAEVDAKVKDGRNSLTDMQQATNTLNNDWQDLANHGGGKVLLTLLDQIVTKADAVYQQFSRWGSDDAMWATISARLTSIAGKIRDIFVSLGVAQQSADEQYRSGAGGGYTNPDAKKTAPTAAQVKATPAGKLPPGSGAPFGFDPSDGYAWAGPGYGPGQTPPAAPTPDFYGIAGAQYGGPVLPNRVYTVGEAGPETLVMGASGGHVIPNSGGGGGGGSIVVNVNHRDPTPWEIANEIHWQQKTRRLG